MQSPVSETRTEVVCLVVFVFLDTCCATHSDCALHNVTWDYLTLNYVNKNEMQSSYSSHAVTIHVVSP